jgi:Na+-transporting methylmalonyl-CoA/oxaloacetate decarboxylase gamma subunit
MHSVFNTINLLATYHVGDDGHNISVSLPYLMGFVVVLVTLSTLMGLCMGIGSILQRVIPDAGAATSQKRTASRPAPAQPVSQDDIPPEILTVISAAVATMHDEPSDEITTVIAAAAATMIDEPHRIVSIKPQNTSWSQAGRQQIQTSHNLR